MVLLADMIEERGARYVPVAATGHWLRALARPAPSRSRERYRRAALTFIATVATKTVALAALLASVPLGIGYLGAERFGVWMTALSAAGLLSFANLGFDKGLLNALAAADGRDDRTEAGRLVATAFVLLGGVFGALLALFALLYPVTPWARLLNVGPAFATEAGPVMAALTVCALLALLASLVDTVQAAYQEGFLNGFWEGLGKLLALAALGAAILCGMSLPWLALVVAAAPLLAAAANAVQLFGRRRPWLAPRARRVTRRAAGQLLGAGSYFFLGQLALSVAYYADNLIVAQLAGSAAVASYAVLARLFDVPGMLLLMVGSALWPPLAEAIARGDIGWAERGLRRLILVALALTAATTLPLMLFGPVLMRWWVGGTLAAPDGLFIAFGLFWLLSALSQSLAVFLSAANALRFYLGSVLLLAAVSVALKLLLSERLGMVGVAWGRVGAELLLLLPYALYVPSLIARLKRERAVA